MPLLRTRAIALKNLDRLPDAPLTEIILSKMPLTNRNKSIFSILQWLCCILGIASSLYLLAQHTRLKSGIQESASFCTFGKYADCDVVNASHYSEIAGVPLAALGAIFYFLCLCLSVMAPRHDKNFVKTQQILGWLGVAALIADLGMLGIQLFALQTLCVMCLFTYLCSAGVLASAVSLCEAPGNLGKRLKSLLFGKTPQWTLPLPLMLISGIALICFTIMTQLLPSYFKLQGQNYAMVDNALENFFQSWRDRPTKKISVKSDDATTGNPQSKIQLIEFSDFQCPHCRRAAFTLHTALKPLKDDVQLVFKHFPLDSSCNPALKYQLHPHACKLARLAFCANRKGKFWEFHDTIFLKLSEETVATGIEEISSKLGEALSPEEVEKCLNDPKSLAAVADDISAGSAASISGTPALFLNGKLISIPITVENLKRLIQVQQSLTP